MKDRILVITSYANEADDDDDDDDNDDDDDDDDNEDEEVCICTYFGLYCCSLTTV
jgi:hypothetical protein